MAYLVGGALVRPDVWETVDGLHEDYGGGCRKGAANLGSAFVLGIMTAMFLAIVLHAMAATTAVNGILGALIVC